MGVGGWRHCPADLPLGWRPGSHFLEAGWTLGLAWTGVGSLSTHRDSISEPSSPWVAIPTELSRPAECFVEHRNVLCSRMCCDVLLLSITFTKVWKGRNGTKRKRSEGLRCISFAFYPPGFLPWSLVWTKLSSTDLSFFLFFSYVLVASLHFLCVFCCVSYY
jgi:hypothetical protein